MATKQDIYNIRDEHMARGMCDCYFRLYIHYGRLRRNPAWPEHRYFTRFNGNALTKIWVDFHFALTELGTRILYGMPYHGFRFLQNGNISIHLDMIVL